MFHAATLVLLVNGLSSAERMCCISIFQNLEKFGFKSLRPSNKVKMFIFRVDIYFEHVFLSKGV